VAFKIFVLRIQFMMQFSNYLFRGFVLANQKSQISRFVSIWKDWCTIPTSLGSIFEWESIKHHDQSSELPGTKVSSHGLVQGWPRRGRQAIFGPQGLSDGPQRLLPSQLEKKTDKEVAFQLAQRLLSLLNF
jgi:hypothetical protein